MVLLCTETFPKQDGHKQFLISWGLKNIYFNSDNKFNFTDSFI